MDAAREKASAQGTAVAARATREKGPAMAGKRWDDSGRTEKWALTSSAARGAMQAPAVKKDGSGCSGADGSGSAEAYLNDGSGEDTEEDESSEAGDSVSTSSTARAVLAAIALKARRLGLPPEELSDGEACDYESLNDVGKLESIIHDTDRKVSSYASFVSFDKTAKLLTKQLLKQKKMFEQQRDRLLGARAYAQNVEFHREQAGKRKGEHKGKPTKDTNTYEGKSRGKGKAPGKGKGKTAVREATAEAAVREATAVVVGSGGRQDTWRPTLRRTPA